MQYKDFQSLIRRFFSKVLKAKGRVVENFYLSWLDIIFFPF
jgi:hypothetical protein